MTAPPLDERQRADAARILSPDTYAHGMPHAAFRRLRARAAVVRFEEQGVVAVLRHAEVRQVLRSPRLFSSHLGGTQIIDPATPEDLAAVRRMMLNMDPPDHSRLRSLLARAFTPRAVDALGTRVRSRARALVDAVAERGECDFATEVAADLPVATLAEILGVPATDRGLLYDWSNRVVGYQDQEYAACHTVDPRTTSEAARHALELRPQPDAGGRMPDPRSRHGMPDLYAYAHRLGELKREGPPDDIMGVLMRQVDTDGGRVSVEEFEQLFWLLTVAGNETLRNGLPGGLLALISHPDQYRRLREDRSLLPGAVEEMLRWWTPVLHIRRTATADTELGGVPIRAGEKVVVYFGSANRDERVFNEPDTFDVGRAPVDHLAFGHGPHFCLGAQLARLQMREMFAAVLDRLGEVELAGEPRRLRSDFQNGVKHLPIRWRPVGR
ncbi:cytochrome P450 [Streptomyces sp. RPT161]|uniref:cytochrome P450 n=1 Tax=Streptomyces sp. RPT161 TaxID=3015993 RepID=UPI0022B8DFD3|nr:cytochrome P450 [Streptomyces sp. RPT161]